MPSLPILDGKKKAKPLLERIYKSSETGRALIDSLAKQKTTICTTTQKELAAYNTRDNMIAFNPAAKDSILSFALVHEMRHAWQIRQGINPAVGFEAAAVSQRKLQALEADAQTFACQVAWEMKENGDPSVWKSLRNYTPEMTYAFEGGIKHNDTKEDRLTATMLSWYKQPETLDTYEKELCEKILSSKTVTQRPFNQTYPAKDLVAKLCRTPQDGKPYFTQDPSILNKNRGASILPETRFKMRAFFASRKMRYGLAPDKSLEALPTRQPQFKTDLLAYIKSGGYQDLSEKSYGSQPRVKHPAEAQRFSPLEVIKRGKTGRQ